MLNIMGKRIIPLLIAAALLAALTACAGGGIPGNSDGNKPIVNDEGNQTGVADAATKPTEKTVKITNSAPIAEAVRSMPRRPSFTNALISV